MKKLLFCILVSVSFHAVFAAPSEIIIVRHGDKTVHSSPEWKKNHGSDYVLSAKGVVRSVKLAQYVIKKFKSVDHVIAPVPQDMATDASSIRPETTAGPIVNMMASERPNGFKLKLLFSDKDYSALAHLLLTDKQFDHQRVLIIWNHNMIPQLANLLGIKEKLPVWPSSDFDSVYILNYTDNGKLSHWQHLEKQYPIDKEISWDAISALGN